MLSSNNLDSPHSFSFIPAETLHIVIGLCSFECCLWWHIHAKQSRMQGNRSIAQMLLWYFPTIQMNAYNSTVVGRLSLMKMGKHTVSLPRGRLQNARRLSVTLHTCLTRYLYHLDSFWDIQVQFMVVYLLKFLSTNEQVKKVGRVARAICIMKHPIPDTKDSHSVQIILPKKQLKRKSDM